MAVIRFGRQCDTLQESCCMTIVMDNFVSNVDARFLLFVLRQARVNKQKVGPGRKKCIHHLMQFNSNVTGDM